MKRAFLPFLILRILVVLVVVTLKPAYVCLWDKNSPQWLLIKDYYCYVILLLTFMWCGF